MWNTSAARLNISVHSSEPGIAQMLYFPAASGCPPTTMSLLRAIVVAVAGPGHHPLPPPPPPPPPPNRPPPPPRPVGTRVTLAAPATRVTPAGGTLRPRAARPGG